LTTPHEAQPGIESILEIIARLHEPAPAGCPWCLAQTPHTLAEELVKEAHEVLAATADDAPAGLAEELGDVLLNVLTEAYVAEESGAFTLDDVIALLRDKLIRRHPHVFGDAAATTPEEAVQRWQAVKREEKPGQGSVLDGLPRSLPALMRADEIQQRVARIGFDWPDLTGVVAKVHEEVDELDSAGSAPEQEEEFGDLLFALVNLGRRLGLSSESALQRANDKFTRRFAAVEAACCDQGVQPSDMTLDQLDALWNAAKATERGEA